MEQIERTVIFNTIILSRVITLKDSIGKYKQYETYILPFNGKQKYCHIIHRQLHYLYYTPNNDIDRYFVKKTKRMHDVICNSLIRKYKAS
jgi:hypothetical protein